MAKVLESTQGASAKYYYIKDGKFFCQKTGETASGFVGKLSRAWIKEASFEGRKWNNIMIGIDDDVVIALGEDSQLFKGFLRVLPNINIDNDVEISLYTSKSSVLNLGIKQNEEIVQWFYTKDNPNGLPSPTTKIVKGETKYDWDEVDNFWFEKGRAFIEDMQKRNPYQSEKKEVKETNGFEVPSLSVEQFKQQIAPEDLPF